MEIGEPSPPLPPLMEYFHQFLFEGFPNTNLRALKDVLDKKKPETASLSCHQPGPPGKGTPPP